MAKTSFPNIEALFKLAIENERKASEIYTALSELFSAYPDISKFWTGLCKDELEHIQILENIAAKLSKEQQSSRADNEIWEEALNVQTKLDSVNLKNLETLDDAYELAHELEFSEVNEVFKFLTMMIIPAPDKANFIEKQISNHQQKLIDFSKNYGDRDWRKGIIIPR